MSLAARYLGMLLVPSVFSRVTKTFEGSQYLIPSFDDTFIRSVLVRRSIDALTFFGFRDHHGAILIFVGGYPERANYRSLRMTSNKICFELF
ncbi:hypothetical protein F4804DRAFT_319975 [Jackrogersella minutella]|nr:hypothetical protein F4804DRAFT_319975 [Jackrogersella minutella]